MADIVNLKSVRKARARATDQATAAANRVSHGLTKSERALARAERERLARVLDQARLED
ncbi:hypothetical protein BZG35_10590 [Brevundimonas sp. LM2]|uniref:DUF4169 family protein n=1 Tax=Brevundimonas sp. LM2 TaxID=1938605 RepID=UPI000984029B|nr:DUF4169 family protein [Brevundimonas sp. LM2]AQR62042.1 hypothetical protein BZG35_10590 [Brevundimonas sp. LM2]